MYLATLTLVAQSATPDLVWAFTPCTVVCVHLKRSILIDTTYVTLCLHMRPIFGPNT